MYVNNVKMNCSIALILMLRHILAHPHTRQIRKLLAQLREYAAIIVSEVLPDSSTVSFQCKIQRRVLLSYCKGITKSVLEWVMKKVA